MKVRFFKFAREASKRATYQGSLPRHACQLTVGTVIPVRPDEHQHTDEVVRCLVGIEEDAGGRTDDDAHQGHGYGMDMQSAEQQRPQIAGSAGDVELEITLHITGLHCGKYTLLEAAHSNVICPKKSGRWKSGLSVWIGFQLMKCGTGRQSPHL